LLVASVFWAGGGLFAKGAPMSGPQLAFWRSLTGASVYLAALVVRRRMIRWADLRAGAVGGLGFALSILFLFAAFKSTTLTSANVITALQPILLGFVTAKVYREPLPRYGVTALIVAVVGTVVVVTGSHESGGVWSLRGDVLAFVGVVLGCLYPVGTKSARRTMDALQFQAAALTVATPICLVGALVIDRSVDVPTSKGWAFVVGLVAVGGTGHLIFSWAQHHVSVAASSVILMAEIVASAIGAAVFYDQAIHALQVVGMAVVATGIWVWVSHDVSTPLVDEEILTV
jgi:drug/metabolite transporter (DMT)-like permease